VFTQSPCAQRNSESPITQQMIDAQNARMNRLVQPMIDGNSDMAGLVAALTPPPPVPSCGALTNSNGIGPAWPWPLIGNVGTPVEGSSFAALAVAAPAAATVAATPAGSTGSGSPANASGVAAGPAGSVVPLPPWMARGFRRPGGGSGSPADRNGGHGWQRGPAASMSRGRFGRGGDERNGDSGYFFQPRAQAQIGNSVSNFTCPPVKVIALPQQAPAPAPTPIPAQHPTAQPGSTWDCPDQSECRTANVCLDVKRGCVMSSQVSPQQMAACSQAGYTGNEAFFPCLIPKGPQLPYLGTPMPNPPQYSTVAGQDVPPPSSQNWVGLSGLGCGGGGSDLTNVVVIALGVTAGLFFAGWLAKEMVTA
jgi:hypothetical protein